MKVIPKNDMSEVDSPIEHYLSPLIEVLNTPEGFGEYIPPHELRIAGDGMKNLFDIANSIHKKLQKREFQGYPEYVDSFADSSDDSSYACVFAQGGARAVVERTKANIQGLVHYYFKHNRNYDRSEGSLIVAVPLKKFQHRTIARKQIFPSKELSRSLSEIGGTLEERRRDFQRLVREVCSALESMEDFEWTYTAEYLGGTHNRDLLRGGACIRNGDRVKLDRLNRKEGTAVVQSWKKYHHPMPYALPFKCPLSDLQKAPL